MIQGPSLSQLASYIHGSGGDGPAAAETKDTGIQLTANGQSEVHGNGWLVFPKPNPDASFRLFCFNYAGGGAMIYRPWVKHIGDHIELVAIEPPGRGSRTKEASISDLGQYRKELISAMEPFMDKPCALFGHCLGGLNLYESALSLSQLNKHAIEHIFVSGSRPPHEVASISDFEEELVKTLLEYENYNPFKKFYEQPDDIFIEIIRKFDIGATDDFIAHQELRNILLPAIRADFEMAGTYSPRGCRPLDVPITCFQGVDDTYVSNGQAVGWSQYTRNEFRLLYRESAHYIVVEDRQFIIDTINDTLLRHRTRL
jgi:surfactin synthase thioesterase subunit